ncbi:helix-turn-helix transcriptional regulator [Telmatospirillum siberiense]|uniref:WYL domain-containing protein n=1 Tax=Telmatospirillum siberiense TaxID=382514 RepID=A0A2N3PXC1_9PROT|nr:WYL domain-containing protein [Telmatospirillum siberiense]PKU25054.1 WYL domain-containing protein [Telmatospirillum siberiense]
MTKSARHEKAENLMRLARDMQGSVTGLTLGEIEERFDVSRRTAERMRDAVLRLYPDYLEEWAPDGLKRWRIPAGLNRTPDPIQAGEMTALAAGAESLRHEGREEQAALLDKLGAKLRTYLPRETLTRIEPDYELLVQSEGLAFRPGPQATIEGDTRDLLRLAILCSQQVAFDYRSRGTGSISHQTVEPYGFLYGLRPYLVARSANPQAEGLRLFSLANIDKAWQLKTTFVRDPTFSLADYAARSFGTFQESPVEVAWRVRPTSAEDARTWIFHPSQTMEDQPDGSLIVKFRAGGLVEMCWHLFTWGGEIEVLEPPELKRMMAEQISCFTGNEIA